MISRMLPRSCVISTFFLNRGGDVMTRGPVLAKEFDAVEDVVKRMESAGIRRMPVVDERGSLTGVIAIDDAIAMLSKILVGITSAVRREQRLEREFRPG